MSSSYCSSICNSDFNLYTRLNADGSLQGNAVKEGNLGRVHELCVCMCIWKDTICFTVSAALWRSITLLWILISNLSQVLDPSPQGVLRVVIFKILVGIRIGPFTLSSDSLARRIKSPHTVAMPCHTTMVSHTHFNTAPHLSPNS